MELDISAPQILFAEEMSSREGAVLLIDFGRLRLGNTPPRGAGAPAPGPAPGPAAAPADEEDAFMTPCSTPPGSLLSPSEPPEPALQPAAEHRTLDAADLHDRLYDRYSLVLYCLLARFLQMEHCKVVRSEMLSPLRTRVLECGCSF